MISRRYSPARFSGSRDDQIGAIALTTDGTIFVVGQTCSPDFPTTANAYDKSFDGRYIDAFVSKLSNDLSTLIESTF